MKRFQANATIHFPDISTLVPATLMTLGNGLTENDGKLNIYYNVKKTDVLMAKTMQLKKLRRVMTVTTLTIHPYTVLTFSLHKIFRDCKTDS